MFIAHVTGTDVAVLFLGGTTWENNVVIGTFGPSLPNNPTTKLQTKKPKQPNYFVRDQS